MATASQSLFNMTVAAGDNAGNNQGLLMPKLQYRFRVNFLNFGAEVGAGLELTKQVTECARPQVQFDEITLNVYNSRIYLPGKHAWQTLAMTVRDDAQGNVSKSVGNQLQRQLDFMEQSSAAAGNDYKFETNIQILDGGNGINTPVILENWELYGCYLSQANYQQLSYAQSEAVTIALTLRFDNAIQSKGGELVGVGESVGRGTGDNATGIGAI